MDIDLSDFRRIEDAVVKTIIRPKYNRRRRSLLRHREYHEWQTFDEDDVELLADSEDSWEFWNEMEIKELQHGDHDDDDLEILQKLTDKSAWMFDDDELLTESEDMELTQMEIEEMNDGFLEPKLGGEFDDEFAWNEEDQ